MLEHVVLVDKDDQEVGTMEKIAAHKKGLCHRAFSIFVFRRREGVIELLLQQRAQNKYHSGGLWTNTCCSHPRPNEALIDAGKRRLQEEFNLVLDLRKIGEFHYVAEFDNGLTENELDHVLLGEYDGTQVAPNPDEITDYQWMSFKEIDAALEEKGSDKRFTPWFQEAYSIVVQEL